jgi:hypothetical protein
VEFVHCIASLRWKGQPSVAAALYTAYALIVGLHTLSFWKVAYNTQHATHTIQHATRTIQHAAYNLVEGVSADRRAAHALALEGNAYPRAVAEM